jgi:hypothetical protein
MATTKRSAKASSGTRENLQLLRRENRELRKKIRQLEAECNSYRRTLHAYTKAQITEEDLRRWSEGIERWQQGADQGGSLVDLIKSLEKGKTSARLPDWKCHLDAYRDQQRMVFESERDLEAAIELLWTPELRTLPHDSPDGRSIIVPAEALEYFSRAGLKFTSHKMRSIGDLRPEEIARLRR